MPVERPTFSESWYRVCNLQPRLRSTVQIHRQHYRGRMWYVFQDPSSNQFFRVNEPAYHFVGLLNGHRSVAEVWDICNDRLGDSAPTQGEVIQLLGQLYVSNLLMAEIPPDAKSLFERYRKRRRREVQGYMSNFLFIRIPLFDPDRILNTFLPAVRWLYSWVGAVLWFAAVGTGLYFVINGWDRLADRASGILDPENLPLLFLSFWIVKIFHEFGHAFTCKVLGRRQGSGGEVHVIGIMFLVFTPLPYVDASSSWAFRSKWHRALVGSAGMIVELVIASVAAIIWSQTVEGTAINGICYNVMFIASVSTLLFNGNPLLRYDAYYILSDLLEIPNLAQRSRNYIKYVVKRYPWGVKRAKSPAHSPGEGFWLMFYGLASTVYRVFICTAILMFVASKLFFVGVLLAVAAVTMWLLVPIGKMFKYLAVSPELMRTRGRAWASTFAVAAVLVIGVGLIPATDDCYVEGVVEPRTIRIVYAGENGFIRETAKSGTAVEPGKDLLLKAENLDLTAQLRLLEAQIEEFHVRSRIALAENRTEQRQWLEKRIEGKRKQAAILAERIARLEATSPVGGKWVSPDAARMTGLYARRGDELGMVADLDNLRIRAVAGQDVSALLVSEMARHEASSEVEFRIKGLPPPGLFDEELKGSVEEIWPSGSRQLPSKALGYAVGGGVRTDPRHADQAAENMFTLMVRPESEVRLLAGQRVVVRLFLRSKPLAVQWFRKLRQLFQGRFQA